MTQSHLGLDVLHAKVAVKHPLGEIASQTEDSEVHSKLFTLRSERLIT